MTTGMPVRLRPVEADVLTQFADGADLADITETLGIERDQVSGILTRRCQMNRKKAHALVNGGATISEGTALSPLTAPIARPVAKPVPASPAAAQPTPPPPEVPLRQREPAVTMEQLLARADRCDDSKIRAVAGQLRLHADSLRELLDDEARRVAAIRATIAELERRLADERAKLPDWAQAGAA